MLVCSPKIKVQKLNTRSKEGIIIGYSRLSKGYKIWDLDSSSFVVSRDVTFHENSINSLAIPFSTSNDFPSNVVVPEGEVKEEVDDNIDLVDENPVQPNSDSENIIDERTTNSNEEKTDEVFQDAQDTPQLRRSSCTKKKTGE